MHKNKVKMILLDRLKIFSLRPSDLVSHQHVCCAVTSPTRFDMSNIACAIQEAEAVFSAGTPESTPEFVMESMMFLCFYYFLCVVSVLLLSCPSCSPRFVPFPWISQRYFCTAFV